MAFEDLFDFFDPRLRLPIGGKEYVIEAPNALHGLELRKLFLDPATEFSDEAEVAESKRLLGSAYTQMVEDGIDWRSIMHAGRTALIHYGQSSSLAEIYWRTGVGDLGGVMPPEPKSEPVATPPSRARTARKTPAAARTTKPRGSATGTTRRAKPPSP